MIAPAHNKGQAPKNAPAQQLHRQVGVFGATMMGLGSIVGTGVFVSIGIAADVAGPSVVLAIAVAALVATCNGLSSAQLAAAHPTSGGTYEYGYQYLSPVLGFSAGWMFLCAKSASAATAALGFAAYVLRLGGWSAEQAHVPLGLAAVALLTALVLWGIRRSSAVNVAIVSVTLVTLGSFVLWGLSPALQAGKEHLRPFFAPTAEVTPLAGFLRACALMFVAYTGYGRVATLGEEIHDPSRNIPRAIIVTLVVTMLLYFLVAAVAVSAQGADTLAAETTASAAPLETLAARMGSPTVAMLLAVGAVTAMLGVLLNLILGLSRVLLAMGRRRDMPAAVGRVNAAGTTPTVAVVVVGILIAGLVTIGSVKTTWSFSAFTVLVYYALTNLAALRLPAEQRRFPRWISVLGLVSCLFLAFWVELQIWIAGLALLGAGLIWHALARQFARVAR